MSTTRERDMQAAAAGDRDHWGASNFADGAEYGRNGERQQAIAYLRKCASALESGLDPDDMSETLKERVRTLDLAANAIERGEHVPGPEAEAGR